jgi:hypothetical protein
LDNNSPQKPTLPDAEYILDEFLGDVIRAESRITIMDVSKTRYQFSIRVCAAEYAQVTLNGVPRDTVAVESVDPDACPLSRLNTVRLFEQKGASVKQRLCILRTLTVMPARKMIATPDSQDSTVDGPPTLGANESISRLAVI